MSSLRLLQAMCCLVFTAGTVLLLTVSGKQGTEEASAVTGEEGIVVAEQ